MGSIQRRHLTEKVPHGRLPALVHSPEALGSITHWALHRSSWSSNKCRKGETARGTEQHHFQSCSAAPKHQAGLQAAGKAWMCHNPMLPTQSQAGSTGQGGTQVQSAAHMGLVSPHCHTQPRKQSSFSRSPGDASHAAQPHTQPQQPIIQPITSSLCSG